MMPYLVADLVSDLQYNCVFEKTYLELYAVQYSQYHFVYHTYDELNHPRGLQAEFPVPGEYKKWNRTRVADPEVQHRRENQRLATST